MPSTSSQYRQRLKQTDPDRYEEYLEKQRQRNIKRRQMIKEEREKACPSKSKKEMIRRHLETARKRQKRYRERQKESDENRNGDGKKTKLKKANPEILKVNIPFPCTRKRTEKHQVAKENQQVKWKITKRLQRSCMSEQKKRRIRECDAKRKAERRFELKQQQLEDQPSTSGFITPKTLWNVTSAVRSTLPKSPRKFANVIDSLVCNSTPRKKRALHKHGISARKIIRKSETANIIKKMKTSKEGMKSVKLLIQAAKKIKQRATSRLLSKEFGLNRKTILKAGNSRIPRSDKISANDYKLINDFFKMEHISRPLPQKRYASKHGPGYILQITLTSAFKIFQQEYPNVKIGYAKFCMLKPKNIRLVTSMPNEVCLCPYCLNVKYKILCINGLVSRFQLSDSLKVSDEREFLNVLLCTKSDGLRYHDATCVMGKCKDCGNLSTTIRNYYKTLTDISTDFQPVWNHWEKKSCDDGKVRRVLVTKQKSIDDLISELIVDTEKPVQSINFVSHLFTAGWQYFQYNKVKSNLPKETVLMIMDFAQNRNLFFQDEIKSAHFSQRQVTMHPIVIYRHGNMGLIRESLVFLSDDIGHDHHAVEHFLQIAINHLVHDLKISVSKICIFSDGCASQYKGKGNFVDISLASIPTERNYYGSEHGKGEGDGEIGVINKKVDQAVLGRQVIVRSAQELYEWCHSNLELDEEFSKRKFFHVPKGEIERNRPDRMIKTVKGTRTFHQVQGCGPYKIKSRKLSCFCDVCLKGIDGTCANLSYVGEFNQTKLNMTNSAVTRVTVAQHLQGPTQPTNSTVPCPNAVKPPVIVGAIEVQSPASDSIDVQIPTCTLEPITVQTTVSNEDQTPVSGSIQLVEDKYYAVYFDTKAYIGRLLSKDGSNVKMKFLHSSSSISFCWPRRDDIAIVNRARLFHGPVEIIGHGPFSIPAYADIMLAYKLCKKHRKVM